MLCVQSNEGEQGESRQVQAGAEAAVMGKQLTGKVPFKQVGVGVFLPWTGGMVGRALGETKQRRMRQYVAGKEKRVVCWTEKRV